MRTKLTTLCAAALISGCFTAFAQAGSNKERESAEQIKTENVPGTRAGKAENPGAGKNAKQAKAVRLTVSRREVGKYVFCPVTGERFKVTGETGAAFYKGKIYYFCCSGCDMRFLSNPEKYLSIKQTAPGSAYVCPMGDYHGAGPGKCPKCGMTLTEKK